MRRNTYRIMSGAAYLLLTLFPVTPANAQSAPSMPDLSGYLPGQILCDRHHLSGYAEPTGDGACYMIYIDPSSDPSASDFTMYKKYIGQPAALSAHLKVGPESIPSSLLFTDSEVIHSGYYPTYMYGVNPPCGTIVGDRSTGALYISQPYDTYGDEGEVPGTYSYSDTFLFKVPALNTASLRAYIRPERIVWVPKVTSEVPNLINDGFSLPSCTIVKQQGTNSFYRLTGYVDAAGRHNIQKQYISNVDTLNMWLAWTPYYVEANISYYPSAGNAPLPPGLLVSARNSSTIYFTDDLGQKVAIPSMADLAYLGYAMPLAGYRSDGTWGLNGNYFFSQSTLLRVNQGALDSTPTNNYL